MNDGGPAFPCPVRSDNKEELALFAGMSLRDWFAGQALNGYVVSPVSENMSSNHVAGSCYKYADAMLKERKK